MKKNPFTLPSVGLCIFSILSLAFIAPAQQDTNNPPQPTVPKPISPAAFSFINDQTPTFSWSSGSTEPAYEIQISIDPSFVQIVESAKIEKSKDEIIQYTAQNQLIPDGWYYWRVRTIKGDGNFGGWSIMQKFGVDTSPPPRPELNLPLKASTTLTTPLFSWNGSIWANAFQFEYASDNDFSITSSNTHPNN